VANDFWRVSHVSAIDLVECGVRPLPCDPEPSLRLPVQRIATAGPSLVPAPEGGVMQQTAAGAEPMRVKVCLLLYVVFLLFVFPILLALFL